MGRTGRSEAVRTCLGCREKKPQMEMIRIVRDPDGKAVFDLAGKLPGRGAYVCPDPSCITRLSASSLSHVLRNDVDLPQAAEVLPALEQAVARKMLDVLSMARKAGKAVYGAVAVADALAAGRGSLVVTAKDIASRTRSRIDAKRGTVPSCSFADSVTLGTIFGREAVSVALVTSAGMAKRLLFLEAHLTALKPGSYHDLN